MRLTDGGGAAAAADVEAPSAGSAAIDCCRVVAAAAASAERSDAGVAGVVGYYGCDCHRCAHPKTFPSPEIWAQKELYVISCVQK